MRLPDSLLEELVSQLKEEGIKTTGETDITIDYKELQERLLNEYGEQYLKAFLTEIGVMASPDNGYIQILQNESKVIVYDWDIFIAGLYSYIDICGPY